MAAKDHLTLMTLDQAQFDIQIEGNPLDWITEMVQGAANEAPDLHDLGTEIGNAVADGIEGFFQDSQTFAQAIIEVFTPLAEDYPGQSRPS